MKKQILAVAIGFLVSSSPALAVTTGNVNQQIQHNTAENQSLQIKSASRRLEAVRAGLLAYYTENLAWPAALAQISPNFYQGSFDTPLGSITGRINAPGNYQLVLTPNDNTTSRLNQVKMVSTAMAGEMSGNNALVFIPVPQSASITSAMLSRFPDVTGSGLNTMQTNLDMGGFSIDNFDTLTGAKVAVDDVSTNTFNAATADITTANITTLQVSDDAVIQDTLRVNGDTILQNVDAQAINAVSLATTGNATFGGNMLTQGNAKIDGVLEVMQSATIGNNLTVGGTTTSTSLAVTDTADIQTLNAQTANVNGVLTTENITVNDTANFSRGLNIRGNNALKFSDYGGGWYMSDSQWLRSANGKSIYTQGVGRFDGGIEVAGGRTTIAGDGTIYYRGQDVDMRFLLKGETAVDASNLGGVAANLYARRDTANTFSQWQTFNSGITVRGNVHAANLVTAYGNFNNVAQRVGNLESRMSRLEGKVSGSSGLRWTYIGTGTPNDTGFGDVALGESGGFWRGDITGHGCSTKGRVRTYYSGNSRKMKYHYFLCV